MQHKLLFITLLLFSSFLLTVQHHAQAAREAINPQQVIPVLTVNINQATAEEIAEVLVGVGSSKASSIVSYREENGPFKSLDELQEVKGIGPKTIAKNKEKIIF